MVKYSSYSPCNNRCGIPQGKVFCAGCGRTLVEIINWTSFSEEKRRKINKAIKEDRNFNNE